jgi:predicted permease
MALANQLNMDVFVPALVFAALAASPSTLNSYQALAVGGIAVVLGSGCWPGRWRAC